MSSGTAEGPKNWRGGGGGTLSKGQLFRNVFLVSSILPKNERKQFDLRQGILKNRFYCFLAFTFNSHISPMKAKAKKQHRGFLRIP